MEQDLNKILIGKFNTVKIINLIRNDDNLFKKLISIAISDHPTTGWRAAWLITKTMENNDNRIKKSVTKIIKAIEKCRDGHQRELLKILSNIVISEKHEGLLFNICLSIWEDINKSPSVRIMAFKFVIEIAKKYPDLKNEIVYFTEDIFSDNLSPGIKRVFNKLIKDI